MENQPKKEENKNEFLNHKRNLMDTHFIYPSNSKELNVHSEKCKNCGKQIEISSMKPCTSCKKLFCLNCISNSKLQNPEFICDSCIFNQKNNSQKNIFNKGTCSNCQKEDDIIKIKNVDDVFKYLENENLYKNEFNEIRFKYQGLKFKVEKLFCKNCLNKIKSDGIEYLIKILDLKNNLIIEEINSNVKMQIPFIRENPISNLQQANQILNNQTTNQKINQSNISQNISNLSNVLNQNQQKNDFQINQNDFSQHSLYPLNNLFYNQNFIKPNSLINKIYEQQREQNFMNPNLNLEMLLQQSNQNDNIQFQNNMNISSGINVNFSNSNKENPMSEDDKKGIDELQKQIETMKLCNQLQKNSLDVLYQYISEFYKEVLYHQKINEYQKQYYNPILFNNNPQYNNLIQKLNTQQQNQNNNLNMQSMYNQQLNH
jgi:hypothetical protein